MKILFQVLKGQGMNKNKKVIRERIVMDYKSVMSTPQGRRVLWGIMVSARTFGTSFDDNPYKTAYNEGKRAIGQEIYADIMAYCPDLFLVAQKEFNTNVAQDNKEMQQKIMKGEE